MTQTLAVNSSNDIYLNADGNIAIATDLTAVLQACEQAVKVLQGEVVLDTTVGIPYFQTVWNGVPNIRQFEAALRSAFLNVDGVVEVASLMTNQEGDVLTYSAVIRTIYGGGTVSG